jgi:hypothetical protein
MTPTSELKPPEHNWTEEKLAALDPKKLRIVRENAKRKGVASLVHLCDQIIGSRELPRAPKSTSLKSETGEIVEEYHFVCRNDRGVTMNSDGTFWTASWVVDQAVAQESMKYGARLALHNSKQEASYRQGTITELKRVEYPEDGKIKSRIDFKVSPDSSPLQWAGRSAGEKGYKRRKIVETSSLAEGENQ